MRLATSFLPTFLLLSFSAQAQTRDGASDDARTATEGLISLGEVSAAAGFVDDTFSVSSDGRRLAYVETDGSSFARLRVRDLSKDRELASIDISKLTKGPATLGFLADDRVFLVSKPAPSAKQTGAVLDKAGKVARRYGPATEITLASYGGRQVVAVHDTKTLRGKRGVRVRHSMTLYEASSGKRISKRRTITLDGNGRSASLGFRVLYWRDHGLTAVGIHDGQYDPKIDQRAPDYESWYDLASGKFVKKKLIRDVIGHRRTMSVMVAHSGRNRFAAVSSDRSQLHAVFDGEPQEVELTGSPLYHYQLDSLDTQEMPDGSLLMSLTIDPVHPDAAAARRAVPVWIDIYRIVAGKKKAQRLARIRKRDKRRRTWRAAGTTLVVMPRHVGWSRGGSKLELYRFR